MMVTPLVPGASVKNLIDGMLAAAKNSSSAEGPYRPPFNATKNPSGPVLSGVTSVSAPGVGSVECAGPSLVSTAKTVLYANVCHVSHTASPTVPPSYTLLDVVPATTLLTGVSTPSVAGRYLAVGPSVVTVGAGRGPMVNPSTAIIDAPSLGTSMEVVVVPNL